MENVAVFYVNFEHRILNGEPATSICHTFQMISSKSGLVVQTSENEMALIYYQADLIMR